MAGDLTISEIDIAKLELEPGDILIARIKRDVGTADYCNNVQRALHAALSQRGLVGKVTILVGLDDIDFSILRKTAHAA